MKITDLTKRGLCIRRQRRELLAKGFEEVGDNGGLLWQLNRGGRTDHCIVDVEIAVGGKSVFVKIEKEPV